MNDKDYDRQADLHYAFQFGQDAVRGNFQEVKTEFEAKFAGDSEALNRFEKGVSQERDRQSRDARLEDPKQAAPIPMDEWEALFPRSGPLKPLMGGQSFPTQVQDLKRLEPAYAPTPLLSNTSTFVFNAARWVSGDPANSGEWGEEDRAFINRTRTLYPELEAWGDAAIGFAWGGYSEDVLLVSWADWIVDRHPPFLAYVYVKQINPTFDFGRSGGCDAKLEEIAVMQPWLHAETSLPAWVNS